jgi:D-alanine-D-alanine ligase
MHSREHLHVLFIAKHVFWQGGLHGEDGNHAPYHREIRSVLEGLGVSLSVADSYEALFDQPDCDFVFPLLNRGGFLNSEMLLPLLATRLGLPFLGASPILRGLADDKHLMKLEAKSRGIPTAPWAIFRHGAPIDSANCPRGDRFVIKPNASSASWGVRDASDWTSVRHAVEEIQAEGHDAIVEPFLDGSDIEVPVITCAGRPALLPMICFEQNDPTQLRTYEEKRDLVDQAEKYRTVAFDDGPWSQVIAGYTRQLAGALFPFDYGRFEFRLNERNGTLNLLEVNLNCNLWSQKAFARSARMIGWSHADLIETILCESMTRQGLVDIRELEAA